MDPNSFSAIKDKLSPQTLQDIEGLDPEAFGFGRKECCGAVPEKLRGSMKLKDHIFLGTAMSATQWDPRTENVEGFAPLGGLVKANAPNTAINVCQIVGTDPYILRMEDLHAANPSEASVQITQFSVPEMWTTEAPWASKGTLAVDRSSEYFVFVCAHRTRDQRCGYCGAVLVDLLRSCIAEKAPNSSVTITVMPCSHVGGHIYAGNVLVYSRFGGVCYGLFRPEDVPVLVEAMVENRGAIPPSLADRIRGHMGTMYQTLA